MMQSDTTSSLGPFTKVSLTAMSRFGGGEVADVADGAMADAIFKLRVRQLVATLQSGGVSGEANTMLVMLESLVIAGEIPLQDFMQRVQNLFPDVLDRIEPDLRAQLMHMLHEAV